MKSGISIAFVASCLFFMHGCGDVTTTTTTTPGPVVTTTTPVPPTRPGPVVTTTPGPVVPSMNIVETAQATPELSTLVADLIAANLVDTLSGTGPFTVFAPTNDAFAAISEVVAGLTDAQVSEVLTYHVVGAFAESKDLSDGQVLETLFSGHNVRVDLGGDDVLIHGETNTVAVTIADVVCTNGVVHIVNAVLVPTLATTKTTTTTTKMQIEAKSQIAADFEVKSMSITDDGHWLAVGGEFAALYDLTGSEITSVVDWNSGLPKDETALGRTPILSANGQRVAMQITDAADSNTVVSVDVYDLNATTKTKTLVYSYAGSSSGIALSPVGAYLATTPVGENNNVIIHEEDADGVWSAAEQITGHFGSQRDIVSVAFANYDQPSGTSGTWNRQVIVGVGPTSDGTADGTDVGGVLIKDESQSELTITAILATNTIGNVSASIDGNVLATWSTRGAVYDVQLQQICGTFGKLDGQVDEFSESFVPFALSRSGVVFAAASKYDGVTVYVKSENSLTCTLTPVATVDINTVDAMAISGDGETLAIVGFPHSTAGGVGQLLTYDLRARVNPVVLV